LIFPRRFLLLTHKLLPASAPVCYAFARLFFSDAEVIVLDEATSALDETTEEKLFAAIKDQLKNKLVIMITHRPKNLIYADEIIELKQQWITTRK